MDIEQEIVDKGLTAPRVTPEDIQNEIVAAYYFTAKNGVQGSCTTQNELPPLAELSFACLGFLTFCVLVLRNGFTVTGEAACASPENYNAELGRKRARQKAEEKIWPLLGFRLRDKLSA